MPRVLLIGNDGEQLGVMSAEDALAKARAAGLDLVEVAPEGEPPVCKILDYGKFKYGSRRKEGGGHARKQHFGQIREIRLRPKIDKHDLERKLTKARELLEQGYRLQLTCRFRGREMTHLELGHDLLEQATVFLADVSKLERRLLRDGRRMNLMLMPKIEVVRAKTKERDEKAKAYAAEVQARRKKSKKKRDSVRRKPVQVDGDEEPLAQEVEIPETAATDEEPAQEEPLAQEVEMPKMAATDEEPAQEEPLAQEVEMPETAATDGEPAEESSDAQAEDSQGTEEKN